MRRGNSLKREKVERKLNVSVLIINCLSQSNVSKMLILELFILLFLSQILETKIWELASNIENFRSYLLFSISLVCIKCYCFVCNS